MCIPLSAFFCPEFPWCEHQPAVRLAVVALAAAQAVVVAASVTRCCNSRSVVPAAVPEVTPEASAISTVVVFVVRRRLPSFAVVRSRRQRRLSRSAEPVEGKIRTISNSFI